MQKAEWRYIMSESSSKEFSLMIPDWPHYHYSSYRYFNFDEKHISRICSYYVLLFILKNSILFTEDGEEIEVRAGEWYIQLPGKKQEGRKGSPSPEYYFVHFSHFQLENSEAVMNDDTELRKIILPIRGTFDAPIFKPLFDQLEYLAKRRPVNFLARQTVFLNILNNLYLNSQTSLSKAEELTMEVMDYLSANFNKSIGSEELAEKFHFSSDYITRLMKKSVGITPWQYIQQLRIERAQELLATTDQTLNSISLELGYSDLSLFFKAFKKHTGLAPGQWRLKSRGLI